MASLTLLGTGCGFPAPGRYHTSSLLQTGETRILIDAGEPCSHRLAAAGISFASLDAILISHCHSDHVSGLPMVFQGAWLEKRRTPLPVHLPAELVEPLLRWMEAVFLPPSLLGFDLVFHPWEEAQETRVGPVEIAVHPTTHLDGLKALIDPAANHRFKAFSFGFRNGGDRWLMSADIGAPEDLDPHWGEEADFLVCELAHYEPETLFRYLADKPFRRLFLTHLDPGLDVGHILDLAKQMLPHLAEIIVPDDGHVISF